MNCNRRRLVTYFIKVFFGPSDYQSSDFITTLISIQLNLEGALARGL